MKKPLLITIIAIATLVSGCKYQSIAEATKACEDWASKGFNLKYFYRQIKYEPFLDDNPFKVERILSYQSTRYCELEEATNQVLGYQDVEEEKEDLELKQEIVLRSGTAPKDDDNPYRMQYKVTTRYKY